MRLRRDNIFETNSSSTHTLVITKEYRETEYDKYSKVTNIDPYLDGDCFYEDDYVFDRAPFKICDNWDEKLAYMYIVLRSRIEKENHYYKDLDCKLITQEDFDKFIQYCTELYNELVTDEGYHIKLSDLFKILELKGEYGYSVGSVDHDYEVPNELVERCITDKEFLKRFIFCRDSYIAASGDEYEGYYIKTVGFQYDYEDRYQDDSEYNKKLKEYQEKYDVYFKGN